MENKFIIVSNPRSGSTWLTSLFGEIPGTFTDYEFKWRPQYEAQPIHQVFDTGTDSIENRIASISGNHQNVGSKLVLDHRFHSNEELIELSKIFSNDLKIVHLIRDLRQVFISIIRGQFINKLSDRSGFRDNKVMLKSMKNTSNAVEETREARIIERGHCMRLLRNLVKNDIALSKMRCQFNNYFQIQYSDINEGFPLLLKNLSINAEGFDLDSLLASPPVIKMPSKKETDVVVNIDELEDIIELFSDLRQQAIEV